jgi:octopine oxidase subunit B
VAVVGGGLVGAAIAWGLAREGRRVVVLDEGDIALRASRGNFALVWVQNKGLGMPAYGAWTLRSSESWAGFAELLREQTGIDVHFERPGGFHMALSERELEFRAAQMKRLHEQPGMPRYAVEMLDHAGVKKLLPEAGPQVAGASFTTLDGHCNSLKLFRALHLGIHALGVSYRPNHNVDSIAFDGGEFRLATRGGVVAAGKVVLAAGAMRASDRWSGSTCRCVRSAASSS